MDKRISEKEILSLYKAYRVKNINDKVRNTLNMGNLYRKTVHVRTSDNFDFIKAYKE